jgi:hypothetical protein
MPGDVEPINQRSHHERANDRACRPHEQQPGSGLREFAGFGAIGHVRNRDAVERKRPRSPQEEQQ